PPALPIDSPLDGLDGVRAIGGLRPGRVSPLGGSGSRRHIEVLLRGDERSGPAGAPLRPGRTTGRPTGRGGASGRAAASPGSGPSGRRPAGAGAPVSPGPGRRRAAAE